MTTFAVEDDFQVSQVDASVILFCITMLNNNQPL